MNGLRVLAADRNWARDKLSPFGTDIDDAIAKAHLGMGKLSVLVADDHAALEPDGLLEPVERRPGILVEHARGQRGAAKRIIHDTTSCQERRRSSIGTLSHDLSKRRTPGNDEVVGKPQARRVSAAPTALARGVIAAAIRAGSREPHGGTSYPLASTFLAFQ